MEAAKSKTFNEGIELRCKATTLWRSIDSERRRLITKTESRKSPTIDPPLQNFSAKPVLIGRDAIALYPSMDTVATTEMIAKTIIESSLEFENIDTKYLLVYLKLVLGDEILKANGLGHFIPKRTEWRDSKARSLSSKINREMKNWSVDITDISWEEERLMVALMMKCAILALMDSTCYSFGGQLFRQMWGRGLALGPAPVWRRSLWAGLTGSGRLYRCLGA